MDSMKPVNDTINDKYAPGVNHTQLKIYHTQLKIYHTQLKIVYTQCFQTECILHSAICKLGVIQTQKPAFLSLTKVNDKYAGTLSVIDLDSLACIFVIDQSQWQICMKTKYSLDSETCIFVIDQMHICHWPDP